MKKPVSISIETSCRGGGVALGSGDKIIASLAFDASRRSAVHLVSYLDQMLASAGLKPADLDELYVSAGPGSFTGLRVGITVARTLAGSIKNLKCVAVPTPHAIAENVRDRDWDNLAVVFDAKEEIYVTLFKRDGSLITPTGEPSTLTVDQFIANTPKPVLVIGEGLRRHEIAGPGITLAAPVADDIHLPKAVGVYLAGRASAKEGKFTPPAKLLPIYTRKPEALRLWQKRHGEN